MCWTVKTCPPAYATNKHQRTLMKLFNISTLSLYDRRRSTIWICVGFTLCGLGLTAPTANAQSLSTTCVTSSMGGLVNPSQPLPPNSSYVYFANNCGQCVDITTAPFKNGGPTDFGMTWYNVGPNETRRGILSVDAIGTFERRVTNVQTCASSSSSSGSIGGRTYKSYKFCMGELENQCESGIMWMDCWQNTNIQPHQKADAICNGRERSKLKVISNRDGQRCGYTVYEVACFD
jgi:hypothetical protein